MISPNDTFTVYLDKDEDATPQPQRRALVYRYGTAAELRQHEVNLDALGGLIGTACYIDAVEEAASFNLVEKRNLMTPGGKPTDRLSEALTLRDMRAIAGQITYLAELTEADRKNSDSPSPSRAAASVESAADDPADA